ncbi:hotdog fold thioesterase, partial [Enterobacter intestinihominis]
CTEGEQKVVGLEVNANHIRSVRSGRVGGVLRAQEDGSSPQGWQSDIMEQQDRLCCLNRMTKALV